MRGKVFQQFEGMSVSDFRVINAEQARAIEEVSKYIMDDLDPLSPRGLTLLGPTGVGKTMLACIALQAATDRGVRTECLEMSSYMSLLKKGFEYQDAMRAGNEEAADLFLANRRRLSYIQGVKKGAQLLLLDDIGREHESATGWSSEQLFDMVRFRFNRGWPTILTSNSDLDELERRYTEGLSSFLKEATRIIRLDIDDFREERSDRD